MKNKQMIDLGLKESMRAPVLGAFLGTCLLLGGALRGQSLETLTYDVVKGDTFLKKAHRVVFDARGLRQMETLKEYYFKGDKLELGKEMSFRYDSVRSVTEMTESNYDARGERGKIQRAYYLDYLLGKAQKVRTYDAQGVLLNEDSMRYDRKKRLAEKFSYSYSGSTGKFSEAYRYDRKGFLKKKVTFFYWFSIKKSGKYVEKKDRIKTYRYKRGPQGRLTGIRYDEYGRTKGAEVVRYDEEGRKNYRQLTVKTVTKNKEKKKKVAVVKTTTVKWEAGMMIDSFVVQDGKTLFAYSATRQLADSVVCSSKTLVEGQLTKQVRWTFFDKKDQIASETVEEFRNGKVFQRTTLTYDIFGNVTKKEGYLNDKKIFDEVYQYEYAVTKKVTTKKIILFNEHKFTVRYFYDIQGRLIKEERADASGKTTGFVKFVF